jgi:hypothetical protein
MGADDDGKWLRMDEWENGQADKLQSPHPVGCSKVAARTLGRVTMAISAAIGFRIQRRRRSAARLGEPEQGINVEAVLQMRGQPVERLLDGLLVIQTAPDLLAEPRQKCPAKAVGREQPMT